MGVANGLGDGGISSFYAEVPAPPTQPGTVIRTEGLPAELVGERNFLGDAGWPSGWLKVPEMISTG